MLAKINKLGYVLHNSQTKITSQLFEKREWIVTIVNNVEIKHLKTSIIEYKQASSTGPSLCAGICTDCSKVCVTIVHNIIVRQQKEPSLCACLGSESSTINVAVKFSLYHFLDSDSSIVSKSKTSPGLTKAKENNINKDIDALITVTCVSPEHWWNKKRKEREVRTVTKVVLSQTKQVIVRNLHVTHDVVSNHQLCKVRKIQSN